MSKEAMKLALEALKQIDEAMPFPVAKLAQAALREALAEQPAQQDDESGCRCEASDWVPPADWDEDGSVAGLARRAAISQPAQQETIKQGWDVDTLLDKPKQPAPCAPAEDGVCEALDCSNHKPAQQEPVAWMSPHGGFLSANYINNFALGLDKEIHNIPLYTSPPAQRTWVGLSDLNIDELENNYMKSAQTAHEFLRAIEAKLKERNQ